MMGNQRASAILAANLSHLMESRQMSNAALEKAAGKRVTRSTIDRMRKAESNAGIDNVQDVADALGVPLWQLLSPNLGKKLPSTERTTILDQDVESGLPEEALKIARIYAQLPSQEQGYLREQANSYKKATAALPDKQLKRAS